MTGRLFTTPDRIIEAARLFAAERTEKVVRDRPAEWPISSERPLRPMRAACRLTDAPAAE